jgi:RNA polymerase sigma-70 factor (ECF subfamily)
VEDSAIVDLYLAREEEAIGETSRKYGARLRGLAYGIVADHETAEECENDTYVQAWGSIPPHEPRDYLYPFLARITRHISLNCCRDRKRLKRQALVVALSDELAQCLPGGEECQGRLEERELKEALDRFLAGLTPEKRAIFLRRYWFLDSIGEISRRFGLSQSKVKTTLYRGRNQLRVFLEQEGFAP